MNCCTGRAIAARLAPPNANINRSDQRGSLPLKTVTFAVVGCGNIGTRHLAILDAQPNARLLGYCDIDPAKRARLPDLHDGVAAYETIGDLLARCNATVVSICTPNYLHAEYARHAIAAGRHVLVEKPMALTTADEQRGPAGCLGGQDGEATPVRVLSARAA